jgi:hypothetical protein
MDMVVGQDSDAKFREPVIEERPVTWKAKIPKSIASDG